MRPFRTVIHSHPRLFVGLAAGIAVGWLAADADPLRRVLLGWNSAVWVYLLLMALLMTRARPEQVKASAENEDESGGVVLILVCVAAVASLVAIIFQLANAAHNPTETAWSRYAFTIITVAGSWLLMATMFALHYARHFYRSPTTPPLRFPEQEANPNYWDFLYFSFTIAVALQTADVSIMSRHMRRMVLLQAMLTFVFNTAILGLSINIAASLVGSP